MRDNPQQKCIHNKYIHNKNTRITIIRYFLSRWNCRCAVCLSWKKGHGQDLFLHRDGQVQKNTQIVDLVFHGECNLIQTNVNVMEATVAFTYAKNYKRQNFRGDRWLAQPSLLLLNPWVQAHPCLLVSSVLAV